MINDVENNTSDIENFTLPMKFISLHVTGPTLLYFYSDVAKEERGFLIEYWYVVYMQIDDVVVVCMYCVY